jgi:subtilisin family serine protease
MPWEDNIAWDDAIAADVDNITVGGYRDNEFLYRPGQLVCDRNVWEEPRDAPEEGMRERLREFGARSLTDDPQDNEEGRRGQIAAALDLHLLAVSRGAELRVADESRRTLRGQVGLVHVMVASPQRHGGCSPPKRIDGAFIRAQTGGQGKKIAVLDTGISGDSALPFGVAQGADVEPPGGIDGAAGHGTMVAGVIAQIAPDAELVIRGVLAMPNGTADEIDIVDALKMLPDEIDIVNASFSGRAVDDATMVTFKRGVDDLPPHMVIVAAAGNEKRRRPQFMAAFKRVIGVTSVEEAQPGVWELADYSNRGWWCDMCAPGTDVVTVNRQAELVEVSGTSFAAPKVTARIAVDASAGGISVVDAAAGILGDPAKPLIPDAGRLL